MQNLPLLSRKNWFQNGPIWVIGHAWSGCELLENERLANHFSSVGSPEFFEKKLLETDGQFAVVIQKTDGEWWLGSDRLRHFPLFYTEIDGIWQVSDMAARLRRAMENPPIDENQAAVFLQTGYSTGSKTLIDNLFQTEAGEAVFLKNECPVSRHFYHEYLTTELDSRPTAELENELFNRIHRVFERQFARLAGCPLLAIPLTGGFDSRLIAAMACYYFDTKKILFFTYGRSGNPEFAPAQKVAQQLGCQWIGIKYDQNQACWPGQKLALDCDFDGWISAGGQLASMPFLQDWPALVFLKKNGIVPPGTVFLPGHSGDMLAGSHLTKQLGGQLSMKKISAAIEARHFTHFHSKKGAFEAEIFHQIERPDSPIPGWLIFENWDLRERQSKFILRSAEIFRHFGFEYATPLWDAELIDFFKRLPFDEKLHKRLYNTVLRKKNFAPRGIDFISEVQDSPAKQAWQRVKNRLKSGLPNWLVARLVPLDDFFCYREMVKNLLDELPTGVVFQPPRQPNFYNAWLSQWFLFSVGKLTRPD